FARHSAWRNNASTFPFNSQTRKLRTSVCFLKSSSISNVVIVGACDCRCIGGMPESLLQNSENRLTKEGVRLNRMRLKETILEPYPGPRPFEKNERSIFFGRNEEIADLRNLCMAYPVVVLYSQSGAGKSSLIRAGLRPALIRQCVRILPFGRVAGQVNSALEKGNIYVLNALSTLCGKKASL